MHSTMANHEESMRDRILTTIAADGVEPKPRWHFLLREGVVWAVAAGAFVLGSIASALSLYIADASRFMEHTIEFSSLDLVFEAVPLLWIALALGALFYTVHAVRETRRGYRAPTAWLVLVALIASVGAGSVLYAQGLGAALDRYLLEAVPFYPRVSGFRPMHWMRPPEGIIVGTVEDIDRASGGCVVHDLGGREWVVRVASSSNSVTLREGAMVRLFGTTTSDGVFEAREVRPFHGRGGFPPRGGMLRE